MWAPLRAMLRKEFIQTLRDPRMRVLVFVAPLFQLLVFAYAATTDVRHVALAVLDRDRSVESREVVARFEHSGYFDRVANVAREDEARSLLDRGEAQALIEVDAGFGAQLAAGRSPQLQLIADGADSTTVGAVVGYASQILRADAGDRLIRTMRRRTGHAPPATLIELRSRAWFNEDLSSRNFFLPGIAGMLVTLMTLILTSMAVVREREVGTMEQVMVTPLRPWEFILGKTLPFAVIGLVDATLVLVASIGWFHVPMRGNPLFLLGAVILALVTTLSMGLLLSSVSQTQQQALMGGFLFLLPAIMLSGFMFPISNMPPGVRELTLINPLRYLIEILRGVLLKGIGFEVLWPQCLALAILGIASSGLATWRLRKTAD